MKYLGLILVVALVACQAYAFRINENDNALKHPEIRVSYDEQLRNFLEKLRFTISEGNETLGIPPMDPFSMDILEEELNLDEIKGSGQLREFEVTGLAGYTVDTAKISLLSRKITVGLTWPHIYSSGFYKFNLVTSEEKTFFGDGEYELTLSDLSFESVVSIGLFGRVNVKNIDTKISLGALKLKATGLMDDDDLSSILSEAISDMAPGLLEDYQKEVTDVVNEIAKNLLNSQLEGKSLKEILAMLS